MKTTKLLLATPTFYPFYGGAEIRFRRYLPMLREHGVESSVITGTPKAKKITEAHKRESWYSRELGAELPLEKHQDIDVLRYRLPEKPAKVRLGLFHEKLRERIVSSHKETNVIQFLSPFTLNSIETFKLAKKNNIATVIACTLAKKASSNIVRNFLHDYKTKRIYSGSDCVVVSSCEIKDYLIEHGVRNRIEIIANGVDIDSYRSIDDPNEKILLRKKLGIDKDKKVLLNVGSVHPRKGTDLLIKAFKLIAQQDQNIDLYIAGSRVDKTDNTLNGFHREICEMISDGCLQGRVHFLGLIENVKEYMQVSDVFVFPSREEGMGNVVMEAMATGLPVVTTPYLGFPSVFGEAEKHYLLSEFSDESISGCVMRLINHDSIRADLGKSAIENVRDTLGVDKSIMKFADLYKDLSV